MTSIKITEATRRDISDLILIENIAWSGRLIDEFSSNLCIASQFEILEAQKIALD